MNSFLSVNRVAFSIAGFEVYWYGLIICCAIILAVLVATYYCKLKKYDKEMPINIALVILPTGILMARLFAVIFEPELSLSDYFNFRTGGMSILGAIVGGGLGLLVFCLIKKEKNILKYFDVLVVVLLLAQAVGRWGNYFNSEVYGQVVNSNSAWAAFPFAVLVDGIYYQALFFYEFCANMFGFIFLTVVFFKYKKSGYATSWYLIIYGVIRTILEPFRQPEFIYQSGGILVSRMLSISMIVLGAILLCCVILRNKKVKNNG